MIEINEWDNWMRWMNYVNEWKEQIRWLNVMSEWDKLWNVLTIWMNDIN